VEVRAHYEADLAAKEVSVELLYAIRNIVQDAQSALDWTATAVKKKFGKGKWRPYFPLMKDAEAFAVEIEKQIKGLSASQPNIVSAFERHQPYQRGKTELGYLHALAKGRCGGVPCSCSTQLPISFMWSLAQARARRTRLSSGNGARRRGRFAVTLDRWQDAQVLHASPRAALRLEMPSPPLKSRLRDRLTVTPDPMPPDSVRR
jgi:hypothetical protein